MSSSPTRPFHIVLIDSDPTFRLGLRVWLTQFSDIRTVVDLADGTTALQYLSDQNSGDRTSANPVDLVMVDISLDSDQPDEMQGLEVCQEVRSRYPKLPILVLSRLTEPVMMAAVQQTGANGYCPKTTSPAELITLIRQVTTGQDCWILPSPASSTTTLSSPTERTNEPTQPALRRWLAYTRRRLRLSGLQQINASLSAIEEQLQRLDLPDFDRAILAGRRRELLASQWLVKRLLATPTIPDNEISPSPIPAIEETPPQTESSSALVTPPPVTLDAAITTTKSLQAVLFDSILAKLQTSLQNQSDVPLEVDILREDKKRELFYLILRKIEDLLDELRFSEVQPDQLAEKRSPLLFDLWKSVSTDFFGKYYTITVREFEVEVVSTLQQDIEVVQTAILDKIPFVPDLLSHLLFQTPIMVDGTPYAAGSPDALARAELLLDHLMIQLGNAVMQPFLNRFADLEVVKQTFYDRRLLSSRDVERFRNNLSWRYRVEVYFTEPRDIFESQYRLFTFYGRGIKTVSVYAPRKTELETLSGVQYTITLALEARDAVAPRVRSAISVVGSGVVYILTEVVGRGIGLVGRGILKGIGNAWQDGRSRR